MDPKLIIKIMTWSSLIRRDCEHCIKNYFQPKFVEILFIFRLLVGLIKHPFYYSKVCDDFDTSVEF